MKPSKYNVVLRSTDDTRYIAYNCMSNALALMSEEQYRKFNDFTETGKEIKDDTFVEELKKGRFLVEENLNELEQLRYRMLSSRFRTDKLGLTIAPTSDCNFRCIYCYEKDSIKHPPMSLEIQNAIIELIAKSAKTIHTLRVTWYGGEPLLCFDIIKSLTERILKICEENAIRYSAGIVTNGYFLTPEICREFTKMKINSVQVTIDGDRNEHDSRRPLQNGKGTFDTIIRNIKSIKGILPYKINLRVNVDKKNAEYVNAIPRFLDAEGISDVVNPYLAMVKAVNDCYSDKMCYSSENFASMYYNFELDNLNNEAVNFYPTLKSNFCCADMQNAYVIDAVGNLYKCWDDIGIQDRAIGSLGRLNEGQHYSTTIARQYVMYDPTMDPLCRDCSVLPICMGGCHSCRLHNISRCSYMKSYLETYLIRVVKELAKKQA